MSRKFPLFLLLLIFTSYLSAQERKLHVISFIATHDNQIGSHLIKSDEKIKKWVRSLDDHLIDIEVAPQRYIGQRFTLDNLNTFLNDFKPDQKDAIVFSM